MSKISISDVLVSIARRLYVGRDTGKVRIVKPYCVERRNLRILRCWTNLSLPFGSWQFLCIIWAWNESWIVWAWQSRSVVGLRSCRFTTAADGWLTGDGQSLIATTAGPDSSPTTPTLNGIEPPSTTALLMFNDGIWQIPLAACCS